MAPGGAASRHMGHPPGRGATGGTPKRMCSDLDSDSGCRALNPEASGLRLSRPRRCALAPCPGPAPAKKRSSVQLHRAARQDSTPGYEKLGTVAVPPKCGVKGCLRPATMTLVATLRRPRGVSVPALDSVCPAHANKFRPGTKYTALRDGSIKFGGFRPNCTVQTVRPIA
jgi:hypothetical protein